MNEIDRQPYLIALDNYAFGPYASQADAEKVRNDGDRCVWLAANEIDAYGYAV